MGILDIFYNEIVNEAASGRVSSSFPYNILFSTDIEGQEKIEANQIFDDLLIPTLKISNKEEFDDLLLDYVYLATDFYPESDLTLVSSNDEKSKKDKIKTILALLFSNATFEDFNNPCDFLRKRIDFINNTKQETYDIGKSDLLKADLRINVYRDSVLFETPCQFCLTAKDDNGYVYAFPRVKFGISNGIAYIYAIQNKKVDLKNSKKVNRALYKTGEGFDSSQDNYELYEEGNLMDITSSFLVIADAFIGYLSKLGIKEIAIPSVLIGRWNNQEISNQIKFKLGIMKEDEYEDKERHHENIQANLTEKLVRTFMRLSSHYPNFDILSLPMENDSSLHMDISNTDQCNNKLLEEVRVLVENANTNIKQL